MTTLQTLPSDLPATWPRGIRISYSVSGHDRDDLPSIQDVAFLRDAVALARERAAHIPSGACQVLRHLRHRYPMHDPGDGRTPAGLGGGITHIFDVLPDGSLHLVREFPMRPITFRESPRQGATDWVGSISPYPGKGAADPTVADQLYALSRVARKQQWQAACDLLEAAMRSHHGGETPARPSSAASRAKASSWLRRLFGRPQLQKTRSQRQ